MRAGLSQSALLFYNNVLALPVMTSFMLTTTDEIRDVAHYPQIHESSFQVRGACRHSAETDCVLWGHGAPPQQILRMQEGVSC